MMHAENKKKFFKKFTESVLGLIYFGLNSGSQQETVYFRYRFHSSVYGYSYKL